MSDAAPAKKVAKAKKPAKKADHPSTAAMVVAAITALKDRKGSSLAAIKKYIAANYKVDAAKLAPFVRRFLKKAVADGKLTQVKGTGASGSFKLAKVEKPKKVAKPKAKKPAAKKAKKPAAKKVKKAKKPAAKKEKKAKKPKAAKPKKPKAKKATKSPKKAKKPAAKKAAK